MPPTSVHLNGGVNVANAEEVFRELGARVGDLAYAYPDGETGDRNYWIFFQYPRLQAAEGMVDAPDRENFLKDRDTVPQVRIADGVDPGEIEFKNLGYADEYLASYETFRRLRDEGAVPAGVRFQIEYPTPTAVCSVFVQRSDFDRIVAPYERALLADLGRLLASLPHDDIQVQWDIANEFGFIEDADWYDFGPDRERDMAPRIARLVDAVPADVPVGLHLCYGDYKHAHESEPESLQAQVDLLKAALDGSERAIDFVSFTVPQYQDDEAFFAPLADLPRDAVGRLYFGIVPYHHARQAPGTTKRQIEQIDRYVDAWGVCTECGMARVEPHEVSTLLAMHRQIVRDHELV